MAFRFVYAADLHLDSPLRSLALRDTALAELVGNATRGAFIAIVHRCLDEEVDDWLLSGDLYDVEQTSMKTARLRSCPCGCGSTTLPDAGDYERTVGENHRARRYARLRTVMADAGYRSRKLARALRQDEDWQLIITKRGQRAFKIKGLTWIVERGFAWLGRNRRFSKDYEFKVQTSETLIEVVATRLMLDRIAPEQGLL